MIEGNACYTQVDVSTKEDMNSSTALFVVLMIFLNLARIRGKQIDEKLKPTAKAEQLSSKQQVNSSMLPTQSTGSKNG